MTGVADFSHNRKKKRIQTKMDSTCANDGK
jgi:hypothetical protein